MFQPHKMSDFLILKKLVSTRNDVVRTSPVIPYWWCISITTQTWVVITMEFMLSFLKKNKQKNEQTKTRKKKQLNWKKKKKWETSRDVASFSAQANINWTLHVLSHAPANSGWRSDGQILDLKQHVHGVVKLDSLTVGQAKHLVVIQNSVHVFDPQSVYRSVTHNPLVIFSGVLRGDNKKRS